MNQKTAQNGEAALRQRAVQALTAGRLPEGIRLLEQALSQNPQSGEIHLDLGTAYWHSGNPARADDHYAQAADLAPQNPYVLNGYGAFLLEQRQLDDAEQLLRSAFALKPDHYEIPNNLGLLEYRRGNMEQAKTLYLHALRLNPSWANAHANLGDVLRDTKQYDLAEKAYRYAIKLNPDHAGAWFRLADVHIALSREEEAIGCLRRATALDAAQSEPWLRLIGLLEVKGRLDEAQAAIDGARGHASPEQLAIAESKVLRRRGRTAEALALLEKHKDSMAARQPIATAGHFFHELGQLYDREDDPSRAFEAFSRGNKINAALLSSTGVRKAVSRSIGYCRRTFTARLAEETCAVPVLNGKPGPVFLIGFPRSGTTLLTQILSSHPRIIAADEKGGIDRALLHFVRTFGEGHPGNLSNPCYPAALDRLRTEDIEAMRKIYYEQQGFPGGAANKKIYVDKMPLNILHAGFIKRLFPEARFILALRHPCDAVLSGFMQDFDMNPYMQRFLDIKDAAQFYDEVFSLWEHYRTILKLDVHTIHYEDLVAGFRPAVAALLQYLGVEWNDAVLAYDKTALKQGRITTPSYHQVTEKIYTRASGRWLRYREQLQPVLPILAPHAQRYGYSMDAAEDRQPRVPE